MVRSTLTLKLVKKLWKELGDIPVTEDDLIEEVFFVSELKTTFEKGCDKFAIWHWFEDTFNISVAKDLMYLND